LTEQQRKEAFHLLVLGQDLGMTVEASRQIEREGRTARWPPL
jgi:hypothetical protein